MAKFRKKPVVIEAELYRPGLEDCWLAVTSVGDIAHTPFRTKEDADGWLSYFSYMAEQVLPGIRTKEGAHVIREGDYIITGVKGERYPCAADIFHQTYEPV